MAVRHDIGRISAAIEAGRKAAAHIDYGPIVSSVLTDNKTYFGDFQFEEVNQNIFLFGFHKTGDDVNRVGK